MCQFRSKLRNWRRFPCSCCSILMTSPRHEPQYIDASASVNTKCCALKLALDSIVLPRKQRGFEIPLSWMNLSKRNPSVVDLAKLDTTTNIWGYPQTKPRHFSKPCRSQSPSLMQNLKRTRVVGFADNHLTVRAIKRGIDGALGAHGAWLLQPYEDIPLSRGLKNTRSVASVEEAASLAIKHDYQFCVHAIGDRANREVLDIFERQFKANPSDDSRRWRIEHAQHLHPDDIQRFGKLGVIASMQAVHCTSDAVFVPTRLGAHRPQKRCQRRMALPASDLIILSRSGSIDMAVEF